MPLPCLFLLQKPHQYGPRDRDAKNPNITGHVRAYDGSVNKFLVDELSGDYSVNDGAITMKNFKLQALTSTANLCRDHC